MEENAVITLIAMETAEPKRKLTRSAGALYVVLIVLILGVISLANLLYARWQIPRMIVQPALYLVIALCGAYLYRFHTISFRYTLTDQMLAIERITRKHEQTIAAVFLDEISEIGANRPAVWRVNHDKSASILLRRKSILIIIPEHGQDVLYSISPSEEFLEKLTAQWQTAKAQKV